MKRTDVRSDSAGTPTGSMPTSHAAVTAPPALSPPTKTASLRAEPVGPILLRVEPAEPVGPVLPAEPASLRVEPVGPVLSAEPALLRAERAGAVLSVEGVLSVLCGARDVVARASRVPLGDAGCDALGDVVDMASRLRCAAEAVVLSATAALEAARPGSGRSTLVGRARRSKHNAKRTVESSEQVAQMPNVARGLAAGELNAEHAAVLADAARRTSPDAVDSAAELLEAAAAVSPENLREQAKAFVARHDPEAAECELGRQRRKRSASMFMDDSTGMGVLHAELDPISYALMRQALENYNDALWRLDGGRDGTPGQIRDNRQRLADSLFEMITDRNALVTIDHPTTHTPNTARRPQTNTGHDHNSDTDHGQRSDADRGPDSDAGSDGDRGGHNHAERGPDSDAGGDGDRGRDTDHGHDAHSDGDRGRNTDAGQDAHSDADRGRNTDAGQDAHSDADRGRNTDAGQDAHSDADRDRNTDHGQDGCSDADHDGRSDHGHGHNAHAHDRTERPRGGGAGDARLGSGDDDDCDSPAGRSIDRWRPAQAPNQLIVIAEIGVIDGTKPDGTCELLGAGPVPPAILDNLSPDTRIRGALFDTNGEILWLGRSRRHASIAQHLAVAIRDRGCVLCHAPMHRCNDHHINEWKADNGTTDIPNLAALCNDCHNKLHNNNERLERRTAPRRWTTTPRTNTTAQTNTTTPTTPP